MADQNDVIIALQDAVRTAIAEAANEEIKRQKHRLECKLGEVKRHMIGKIVEQIQIATSHNVETNRYTIQINIRPNCGAKMATEVDGDA